MPKLEKIILGDDHIDFAKKAMPTVPGAVVEFVDTPGGLREKVEAAEQTGQYDLIISDYDYGAEWRTTGLDVFRYIVLHGIAKDARKILWTGNAGEKQIQEGAAALGIELLDKDELGTLVGMAVSKAPIKKGGAVYVFVPEFKGSMYRALRQSVSSAFDPAKVAIGDDLKAALQSGKYGLIIDASTLGRPDALHGTVAHDMKYIQMAEVPKVVIVRSIPTVLADIAVAAVKHYENK